MDFITNNALLLTSYNPEPTNLVLQLATTTTQANITIDRLIGSTVTTDIIITIANAQPIAALHAATSDAATTPLPT